MLDFIKNANACVKCAKCVPDCTVYQIKGDEVYSPRGFIDLLSAYQHGKLELNAQTKDIFESCFLCTHCVSVCPASLPTDELIESVRVDIAKTFGMSAHKRLFFYLLKNRAMMNLFSRTLAFLSPLLFKPAPHAQGLVARFPLPFLSTKRVIPRSHAKSFLESHPQDIIPASTAHMDSHPCTPAKKVAIFIGCLSNYNYPSVGDCLLQILNQLGFDVLLAKGQGCCGAPAHFTGDHETTMTLLRHNVEYFESLIDEVEAVLVPEATCAAMILHDYKKLAKSDPKLYERVERVSAKFFMATEWLYQQTPLQELLASKKKQDAIITYHDPCHARKVLRVFKEPRALLAINYTLHEMSDPNRCCGFGGITMQSEKYANAKKAGEAKVMIIKDTDAQIVSAECNACRIQLEDSMAQAQLHIAFTHPLELIAKALRED